MRVGVAAATMALLVCAAPAQAQVSSGDDPAPDSGLFAPDATPPPSIAGTERVGQPLSGSDGFAGAESREHIWLRCGPSGTGCTQIATTSDYTPVDVDTGMVLKFRVRGNGPAFSYREAEDATGAIVKPPANDGLPPVPSGTLRDGQILTGGNGSWTGTPTIAFTYQWQRCTGTCSNISGATAISYTLTAADVTKTVRLKVRGTRTQNAADTATAYSPQTSPIQPITTSNTGAPLPVGGGVTGSPGTTTLRKLSPFPVIAIGGRILGRRVRVSQLLVSRAPRGAVVTVTCKGRDCPFRRLRRKVKRTAGLRLRGLERSLRSGTVIVIVIRKGNTIGKYTRLRMRRGAAPARIDRCIRPGARRPSTCPS